MTGGNVDPRRAELRELISTPGEKVNVDMLMDVLVALYTDTSSAELRKNKNVKQFMERYEPYVQRMQCLRPRVRCYNLINQ